MKILPKKYLRRNIAELKEIEYEFGRFIMALRNLELSDDWPRICGIHGNTFKHDDSEISCPTDPQIVEKIGNTPDEPFYCAHSEERFIVWHTPYVYQFELLLNKYNKSDDKNYIPLPYLWLENNGVDYSFMNQEYIEILYNGEKITITNPLCASNNYYYDTNGNKKTVTRNGFLTPRNKIEERRIEVTNIELNNVMYALTYDDFSSNNLYLEMIKKLIDFNPLEVPHNNVHDIIGGEGGNMSDVAISAYDPLFWLHHCNMDNRFYNWLYNNTNSFENKLSPSKISKEILKQGLAPFFNYDQYQTNFNNYPYGWQNGCLDFLKVENILDFKQFPYSYNKIDIKPYIFPKATIEIYGMPIPPESVLIELYLYPKDIIIDENNKIQYLAGTATWLGINRYLKTCKRCNKSKTNMKINIDHYLDENNIKLDDLKNYNWHIEGKGRLHSDSDKKFKTYTQNEILKDGHIVLLIALTLK